MMKEKATRREKARLTYLILAVFRRVGLAAAVTFARIDLTFQLLFIGITSTWMVLYVGLKKPFRRIGPQRVELWSELCLVILFGMLLTQSDFINNPEIRLHVSWYMLALIVLSIVTQFGYVLVEEIRLTCRNVSLRRKRREKIRQWK